MKNMVAQKKKKKIFQMTMCFRVTSYAQKLAFDFVSSIENCTKIPQLDFSVHCLHRDRACTAMQ